MQASQLRLEQYSIEELRFSLDEDYVFETAEKEPVLSAEDLEVEVEPFKHPEFPLQWYFKLAIRLDDKNDKFPYSFSIRLTGYFEIAEDCPADMIERLALINAPSILYASAREILALITARSRYLSIFLPSVRFFGSDDPSKALTAKTTTTSKTKARTGSKGKSSKVVSKKK